MKKFFIGIMTLISILNISQLNAETIFKPYHPEDLMVEFEVSI
jgi:hypothetical protein